MLRLLLTLLFAGVVALVGYGYYLQRYPKTKQYLVDKVVRTDIVEQVAVTGAAEPLERRLVQPDLPQGATVEELLVDYNTEVKKGQVLARLAGEEQQIAYDRAKIAVDTARSMKTAAEAGLESARQALVGAQAKEESARKTRTRLDSNPEAISNEVRDQSEIGLRGAKAMSLAAQSEIKRAESLNVQAEKGVENAQRLLRLAELQVKKTLVTSPIDGFVLNLDVRVGDIIGRPRLVLQPDAPAAPFELATPLDKMRAVVKLSEADYSRIKIGQKAIFTVEAYPDEKFTGTVTQIRNSPGGDRTATTYPTVIEFANRRDPKTNEWLVRPRATVSADIQVREVKGAVAVPNAALLFAPSRASPIEIPSLGDGEGVVWVKDPAGEPVPRKIKKGITNGNLTQILEGDVREGEAVITAEPVAESNGFQGLPL
ncbi:MAG TPA: efflux RND transporter periplasmic adaptor subunit [Planctomycetia bacterium]|nr:efflux RND transporter periplasmic adaptor subunit [Planctomycetia bacterium]